jgi:hypothetical protein
MWHHSGSFCVQLFLLLFWVEVHCGIYKCSYNVSNISYLNSPLHCSPSPATIPGTVSPGIIFAFIHMCIHYLHHIYPTIPFPNTSHWCQTPPFHRTCSALLFSNWVEENT